MTQLNQKNETIKSRKNNATVTQNKIIRTIKVSLPIKKESNLCKSNLLFKDSLEPMDRAFIEFFEGQGVTFVDITSQCKKVTHKGDKKCPKKKE